MIAKRPSHSTTTTIATDLAQLALLLHTPLAEDEEIWYETMHHEKGISAEAASQQNTTLEAEMAEAGDTVSLDCSALCCWLSSVHTA